MRSKVKRGAKKFAPSQQLKGDLAVMPKDVFISTYNCTEKEYEDYFNHYGADELAVFLCGITTKVLIGDIKVETENLKRLIIDTYQRRIISLNFYEYEKMGFHCCFNFGEC